MAVKINRYILLTQVIVIILVLAMGILALLAEIEHFEAHENYLEAQAQIAAESGGSIAAEYARCVEKAATTSTFMARRHINSLGGSYTSTAYNTAGNSFVDSWFDNTIASTSGSGLCTQTQEVDLSLVFSSTELGYLGVKRTFSSTTGNFSSLSAWRKNTVADSGELASVYTATANSDGTFSLADSGSDETRSGISACQTTACSGEASSVVGILVDGGVQTGLRVTVAATQGTINVQGSSQVSAVELSNHLKDEAEASGEQIHVFSSDGYLVATSDSSEETRISACVAAATTTEAQKACGVIQGSAHPSSSISGAATAFSLSTATTDSTKKGDNYILYSSHVVTAGNFNTNLIVVSVGTSHKPLRIALWSTFLCVNILLQITAFVFFMVQSRSEFSVPTELLSESMRSVMTLDFQHVDDDRIALADLSVNELDTLQSTFFDMAEYVRCFASYVPKEVIRELQDTGNLHSRIMTSKTLTCIFIDIANFTTLCESVSTDDLAEMAEKYFSVATRTLAIHGCTIDKFIGDATVGFWGAPLDYTLQGFSACCAALHLSTVVQRLQPFFEQFNQQLAVRVGLSRGSALVGNIGCDDRIGYTALGSTVLLSEALEGLNKPNGTEICISENVLQDADQSYQNLFLTRKIGTVTLSDVDNGSSSMKTHAAYQLVGLRKSEVPTTMQKVDRSERKKRRVFLDRASTVGGGEGGTVHGDTGSHRSQKSQASNPYTTTAEPENSSRQHAILMGEKFALLTEEQEISNIRSTVHYEADVCDTMQKLTNAVNAYENARFEEAIALLKEVLENERDQLTLAGIAIQPLEKTLKTYEKCQRVKPSANNFMNGVIKL